MAFAQRLDRIAGLTEARLAALVGTNAKGFEGESRVPDRLRAALSHATLGGGKRFRPFLVVESAALFGLGEEAALETAAALECVHCYSLVHDDLPAMDNDALRRGRPTVWKAFDEWTAILAGDALLTVAFEALSAPATHASPRVRLELVSALAKAAGAAGMVGGQALDLEAERLGEGRMLSVSEILHMQSLKTGALLRFACEAGAILGEAGQEDRAALGRYGAALGRAFQIADDLLDAEGSAETVGKAVSKDAAAGKATLVSLLGIDGAREALQNAEDEAVAALAPFGERASMLIEAARFVARRER